MTFERMGLSTFGSGIAVSDSVSATARSKSDVQKAVLDEMTARARAFSADAFGASKN
jgi:hypothetical protein